MKEYKKPGAASGRAPVRRWWMFLPFILITGAIFYRHLPTETAQSQPDQWAIEPTYQKPDTTGTGAVAAPSYSPLERVLLENGFYHEEKLIQLLSYRQPDPAELSILYPEAREVLAACRMIPAETLAQRQEFWLRSHAVTLAAQKQILTDDPVMQYAAIGLIINRKLENISHSQTVTKEDLDELSRLIELQNSLPIQ